MRHLLPGLLLVALLGCTAAEQPLQPPGDQAGSSQSQTRPAAVPEEPAFRRLPAPELPADRPLAVGFLLVDGVYNTELTAPYDIFEHVKYSLKDRPAMEVFTVSPDGKMVTTAEGLRLLPDYGFDNVPAMDVLVIASAEGSRDTDLDREALMRWVKSEGEQAGTIMSLCWGAFLFAETGQLDGLQATTFPSSQKDLADRYPGVQVETGYSFVHHGKALTSVGGAQSFHAALYLVDHFYGEDVARRVAGGLVMDWPPAADHLRGLVVE